MRTAKGKQEKGYTLLEYCAGAAILVSVLVGTLNTVQGSLKAFMDNISTWAQDYKVGG